MIGVTGPLAPLFAQVREAHKMSQVAVSFNDGPQRLRWNKDFDAALSSIERHVQNMEALALDMGEWMRKRAARSFADQDERNALLARLSRLCAGDSNQNEKEQT